MKRTHKAKQKWIQHALDQANAEESHLTGDGRSDLSDHTNEALQRVKDHERKLVQQFLDREHLGGEAVARLLVRSGRLNKGMMLFAFTLTIVSIVGASNLKRAPWPLLVVAGVGTVCLLSGVFGVLAARMQSERLLLMYWAVIAVSAYIMFMSGGIMFFYIPTKSQMAAAVSEEADTGEDSGGFFSSSSSSSSSSSTSSPLATGDLDALRTSMIAVGILTFLFVTLELFLLRDVGLLVRVRRAAPQ